MIGEINSKELRGNVTTTKSVRGNVGNGGSLSGDLATSLVVGIPGATFIPSISDDGVISWTNDRGLDNPDPVNILKIAARPAKIGSVTLLASNWIGSDNLYSQIVDVDGATENSQVDLTPDIQQLAVFYNKDISFVTENDDGVITVYAIGQKPANDYTIQVTITEVVV